jgi:hypothetical protein
LAPFVVFFNSTKGFCTIIFGFEYICNGAEVFLGASWRLPYSKVFLRLKNQKRGLF